MEVLNVLEAIYESVVVVVVVVVVVNLPDTLFSFVE